MPIAPVPPPSGQDRPPTLEDVAARAGVSRSLVSIVMRDAPGASAATRERVRAIADELGYRPDSRARLLAGRHTRLLGITMSLHNPFHADVAEGIYTAAERHGYEVVLSAVTPSRTARAAIDTLLSYRCEAVLLLTLMRRDALGQLAGRQPVVIVGQPSPHPSIDAVRVADGDGVGLAVAHLLGLGHRRIVYIDGGRAPGAAARRAGYRSAMRRLGHTDDIRVIAAGEREEDGAEAARRLASTAMPDAVITYNDRSAVGVLDVFARSGVAVPDEVSVVGYDDSHLARLPYLRLTTISQDTERLAALAVERAVARLDGLPVEQHDVVLTPHLVVRGTTARRRT